MVSTDDDKTRMMLLAARRDGGFPYVHFVQIGSVMKLEEINDDPLDSTARSTQGGAVW